MVRRGVVAECIGSLSGLVLAFSKVTIDLEGDDSIEGEQIVSTSLVKIWMRKRLNEGNLFRVERRAATTPRQRFSEHIRLDGLNRFFRNCCYTTY